MNLPTFKPNDIDYARLMREWELVNHQNQVLERENAALREALQNCAYAASGQNWQQIAWIVEGALYDPRRRRSRERDA